MTSPRAVRFFILGMPIGLIITGIIAMFLYFHFEEKEAQLSTRVPVRRPVSQADLEGHVRTFATAIGSRHSGAPAELASARKYIQSTLGPANLGYRVSRQEFFIDGEEYHNLIIDLPGKDEKRWDETVIVCANYDTVAGSAGANDNASGMAALMSLAQAFGGTQNARALRFVALANEAPPFAGTDRSGSAAYIRRLKEHKDKVVAVISLEGLGVYLDGPGTQLRPDEPEAIAWPDRGNFLALMALGNDARARLEEGLAPFKKAASLPVESLTVLPRSSLAGERTAKAFSAAGFPVIRVTDTGEWRRPASAAEGAENGDTMDKLDFPRLTQATLGLEALLKELVNPAPEGVK